MQALKNKKLLSFFLSFTCHLYSYIMVRGQYALCVLFIDFLLKQAIFSALVLFSEIEPAYNSNILDSMTTSVILEY